MDRRALRVSRSLMPVGAGRGRSRRSSRFTPLQHRQLPPARRHILPQRVGVICRPDPEVPVVRCAPLGDDRQDLDELVPTGEATRRLVTPGARVAVDGNRECIAHPPSVFARDLVRLTVLCGRCSLGDAMPIRLVEGVQRAGARRSAVAGRDVPVKRMTIEAMTADRKTISIRGACAPHSRREPPYHLQLDGQWESRARPHSRGLSPNLRRHAVADAGRRGGLPLGQPRNRSGRR